MQESDCCFVAVSHSCVTYNIHAKDIQALKTVGAAPFTKQFFTRSQIVVHFDAHH